MTAPIFTGHKKPKLTLVGAGPGAADLITIRALNVLKSANIVLYDALVSAEILSFIPKGIPAVSVGKRAGIHSFTQEEINDLIVESAFLHGHVVRLKGGDPFVFGRGYEEIAHANTYGIETEVVPGISSALAVPASVNIPLTARKTSESFWVVTGTTKSGDISGDIALAASSTATVVILMGLNKIREIMSLFQQSGKENVPVAVIQNGTLINERCVVGTVASIAELVEQEKITSPAIIVIGEVVNYSSVVAAVLQQKNNYQ
jgi:uroporphyrin-III C-methyltransferase